MNRFFVSLVFFLLLALLIIVGPFVWPHGPLEVNYALRYASPSLTHPFGTDGHGRDVLARVLAGGRISLTIATLATGLALTLGSLLGLAAANFGKLLDTLFTRLMDALLAFPGFLLVLFIAVLFGGGVFQTILALGIGGAPVFYRLARGFSRSISVTDFVVAAQALGATKLMIISRHVIPNLLGPLLVQAATVAAIFLLVEASLSYLGLGVAPPTPTWGNVLQDARAYLLRQPWAAVGPGLALGTTTLCLQLVSDGLRDRLDPRYS